MTSARNNVQVPPLEERLDKNKLDTATALARGVVGAVPFLGPLLAEVIGVIIPQQRLDRVVDMLTRLDNRLQETEQRLGEILSTEEQIDLLEEAMQQATRAINDTRRAHLANLLTSSLTKDDLDYIQKQRLFEMFDQLNDAEIIILQTYGLLRPESDEFMKKHEDVLWVSPAIIGSAEVEIDREAVHKTFRENLATLGLLRRRFKRPRKGELPEFDERTGMMKSSGYELTSLGRVMLKYLNLKVDY
jgi:hypothetical protein